MQYFERNWFLFCVVKCKTVWRPVYCVASSGDRDIVPLLLKHDLTCRMIIDRIFFLPFLVPHGLIFISFWCLNVDIVCFLLRKSCFYFIHCFSIFFTFLFLTASHHFHSWIGIRDYLCLFLYVLIISGGFFFGLLPFAIFQYYYASIRFFY